MKVMRRLAALGAGVGFGATAWSYTRLLDVRPFDRIDLQISVNWIAIGAIVTVGYMVWAFFLLSNRESRRKVIRNGVIAGLTVGFLTPMVFSFLWLIRWGGNSDQVRSIMMHCVTDAVGWLGTASCGVAGGLMAWFVRFNPSLRPPSQTDLPKVCLSLNDVHPRDTGDSPDGHQMLLRLREIITRRRIALGVGCAFALIVCFVDVLG